MSARAFAPAKVNLYLHVGPLGPDGFHPLESLMVFADVGDWVAISEETSSPLQMTGPFAAGLGGDDNLVLQNISLSVPSRSFVALVGHTGSGKSTLASLLMGYYPLTQGEIRLDGRPLSSLSHSALRQGIAMVQQDPVVMADTFLANVTLGRDISEERVWQALREVPAGSRVSYTDIAERIGAPKAVRAVAMACAANRIAVAIPCHRVVRRDGDISGYRWGVERKQQLLKRETALS